MSLSVKTLALPCREGTPLADLSRHQCRWPVNHAQDGELRMFYGEAVQNGRRYRNEHCQKAYTGKANGARFR
ncbi:GcrA family cell cycle regulator [Ochrobactrum sp. GPK 3]